MKEKILILEDEIGIRSFVSINLKREGYEVIEAGCGQEAIDKIKNEKNIICIAYIYFCFLVCLQCAGYSGSSVKRSY